MSEPTPIIDTDRLVTELKHKALEREAPAKPPSPIDEPHDPVFTFRPEIGPSTKPVIGPLITFARRLLGRLLYYPLQDLAVQIQHGLVTERYAQQSALQSALESEAAARESVEEDLRLLRGKVEGDSLIHLAERVLALDTLISQLEISQRVAVAELREALEAEIRARESVQSDVRDLSDRIASVQNGFDRLQLGPRLARLERDRRTKVPATPSGTAPTSAPPATTSIDYLTFEARFRPEAQVREQQRAYLTVLRDRKRVVDLGCGRGELVELLKGAGVSAYGVDVEPDVVALAQERGLEVVEEDAIAHLESLQPGAVDGVVALHVVEHLDAASLGRLVELAADRLADDGILVLETPNPESLTAGSVNFHRDPTHVRPIHPDTLSFLCESAGFGEVEIRRLSPVPDEDALPRPPTNGALGVHLDGLVERLNALLYGYQDYAVVAKK